MFPLVLCRLESRGETQIFRESVTPLAKSDVSLPENRIPQQEISEDQCEHKLSRGSGDVHSVPTEFKDGEASPVELVLMVTPPHCQDLPDLSGPAGEQDHAVTLHLVESNTTLGTSKKKFEQMTNDKKPDEMSVPSQAILNQQGSTGVFTQGPLDLLVPSLPENDTAGGLPQSWAQKSEPHQTRTVDLLPTFTSQTPPDLQTTLVKQPLTNLFRYLTLAAVSTFSSLLQTLLKESLIFSCTVRYKLHVKPSLITR